MTADRKQRARLIAALPGVYPWGDVVDLLLPVVQAMCEESAADELRKAADWMRSNHYVGPSRHLHNRAAALSARSDKP